MKNKIKTIDFKLKKDIWTDIFGLYKSKFHWTWMEFAEHKQYVPWDNVKYIDWKIFAKTSKLQVKQYYEEKSLKLLFLIDLDESIKFHSWKKTKIDTFQEVFYTISLSALVNNDKVACILKKWDNFEFIPYFKNKAFIWEILDKIENQNIENKKQTDLFDYIWKLNLKNNLIFILSDKLDLDFKNIKRLNINNEIVYINIFDSFENNLAYLWKDFILHNKNSFIQVWLDDKEKIEKYRKLRATKIDILKRKLYSINAWYVYLDEKLDVFKELGKYFKNWI